MVDNNEDPLSLEDISTVLHQLGFIDYLDIGSIKELSIGSSALHALVNSHISRYYSYVVHSTGRERLVPKVYSFHKIVMNKGNGIHQGGYYGDDDDDTWVQRRANEEEYINNLPACVSSLSINTFERSGPFMVPPHITRFTLHSTRPISLSPLHSKVTHFSVTFETMYEQLYSREPPLIDYLPPSLTHLTLNDANIYNFDEELLPCLTHLVLGKYFVGPIDYLPSSLTHLVCGVNFNQFVDYLPPNLKYLKFGDLFNKPVDNLPSSLKFLHFGILFNKPLDNLPSSLKVLSFDHFSWYRQTINYLPPSLKVLKLAKYYSYHVVEYFPQSLKCYYLGSDRYTLPIPKNTYSPIKLSFI